MAKILIALPYRDTFFLKEYGYAVRDLQMLYCLARARYFDKIVIINRPTSVYERILGRRKQYEIIENTDNIITNSYDLLGPLNGRNWTCSCYNELLKKEITKIENSTVYVLDFSPFAMLSDFNGLNNNRVIYWHDMIDNFTKHNRFSKKSKLLVQKKYQYVNDHYDFVTANSDGAANEVKGPKKYVVNNGVFIQEENKEFKNVDNKYDFGFCGFITNKTDMNFIIKLRNLGFSVVFHGKCFDKEIEIQLKSVGVVLTGPFKYSDIENKMSSFSIGLIPYLKTKSHDESPLKIYEYLKNRKPCLTSISYEISNDYVYNYNEDSKKLEDIISFFLKISGKDEIKESIKEEWYFTKKVDNAIKEIFANA